MAGPRKAYIIGAGLSGLSAALRLSERGFDVVVCEQAGHAGGRARSFYDASLEARIDNGNHLLLSGNYSTLDYLSLIGASDELVAPMRAAFHFFDLTTGERWCVDLNRGPVPLWMLYKNRRVPGTSMTDYLSGLKLLSAGDRTIADLFSDQGQIYRRFWEPFSIAVLNTEPEQAVARLLTPVIRETLAKGANASRPMVARLGLSETFVDPAVHWLTDRGADIRFGERVTALEFDRARVIKVITGRGGEMLAKDDVVVLAVPPWAAQSLMPEMTVPDQFAAIVNVHFRLADDVQLDPALPEMIGMIGSHGHWLFRRGQILSVTVSAADAMADKPPQAIAEQIWPEIVAAMRLGDLAMPRVRVIKERRATFAVTAQALQQRPQQKTQWRNLALAGDWTDTGLPATIEGSIRSGVRAATLLTG